MGDGGRPAAKHIEVDCKLYVLMAGARAAPIVRALDWQDARVLRLRPSVHKLCLVVDQSTCRKHSAVRAGAFGSVVLPRKRTTDVAKVNCANHPDVW